MDGDPNYNPYSQQYASNKEHTNFISRMEAYLQNMKSLCEKVKQLGDYPDFIRETTAAINKIKMAMEASADLGGSYSYNETLNHAKVIFENLLKKYQETISKDK